MEQRKALGRGLEALIPTQDQGQREQVQSLSVAQIVPSRFQPRLNFSEAKIRELAQSIKEKGVIQPVLVRSIGGGQYELIAGERRLRALKSLGLAQVPAIVRRVSDADLLETSIIENIQREELNPVEEAKAYRRLAQEFGQTQDQIAKAVGKDNTSISNLLRILNLPEKILDYLSKDFLSLGHAKAILAFPDARHQLSLAERIVKKGLSVRQAEQAGQARRPAGRDAKRLNQDSAIRSLEDRLQRHLGTKVRIRHGRKRGIIEIEYFSLEDLDRLTRLLGLEASL